MHRVLYALGRISGWSFPTVSFLLAASEQEINSRVYVRNKTAFLTTIAGRMLQTMYRKEVLGVFA